MTMMRDERRRIRGDLEAQGAKLSPAAIVEKIRAATGRLRAPWRCRAVRRWTPKLAPLGT
jgi:hypothetical protein